MNIPPQESSKTQYYAMKRILKSDIYSNPEAGFYQEERDVMVQSKPSKWLTFLCYSFQDDSYLYLIMEYLPGGDLLTHILSQPLERLTEKEAKFYISEIILAL